jgi:rifampin ADP-ribosylating transferase
VDVHDAGDGPVTFERCDHVTGPFLHGTRARLAVGDELVVGHGSGFRPARALRHVYLTTLVETAVWGAELSVALGGPAEPGDRGHVYVVEPTGPLEDDPNVTDKKFPGNPTRSYRTLDPLRVVGEVPDWQGHPPEVLQGMLDSLARLRERGLDVIED